VQAKISFHSELPKFKLKDRTKVSSWLHTIVAFHLGKIERVQYIFCDDEYLLALNKEHLGHDTFTDIITFRYQEHPKPLESEIYISLERVRENAEKFGVSFENELHRVMAHGMLHLLGFKDKKKTEVAQMREKEEWALSIF
jgi:probable rRNA maturation factor